MTKILLVKFVFKRRRGEVNKVELKTEVKFIIFKHILISKKYYLSDILVFLKKLI